LKGALGTMVTFGLAVDGSWAQIYHERVQASLEQATLAASTNGERTVAENSLRNDPVLIKFSNCGRFLSSMLGSGIFAENPSCH
jgi:hypothetical protein